MRNTKRNSKTACNRKKAEARQEVIEVFHKTLHRFFPKMLKWIDFMDDPRQAGKTDYNTAHLFWLGTFIFLLKLESRRQINFQFHTEEFRKNLNLLSGQTNEAVADHGTVENLLKQLLDGNLTWLIQKMISRIIRMKVLESYRLLGKHYTISVDGTGHLYFGEKRHCPHCLTRKINGKTHYYHNALEAKVVTDNGFALSIATEMIENTTRSKDMPFEKWKQDCELKAFYRLAGELKKDFPQLKICLLLDSLFVADPVFKLCNKYGWKYIITFKEGSMPETYAWYESLKKKHQPENKSRIKNGKVTQKFNWVTGIKYRGPCLNVLECNERKPGKKGLLTDTRFLWITNLKINECNFEEIAKGGRLRWKIENEGFNTQKNGGYNLEHSYSHNPVAIKNYYLLLQIAHIINQLMEKGSLLKRQIRKTFGSIRNIARQLLEDFRTKRFS
ncbi:MAG: hypothetical protein U9Q21_01470, partial [Candidatus Auribacterota bacterium]|nr:hypothetical protein [Candidatus Auribacterota bacterium]